jgi:hypothetical protein
MWRGIAIAGSAVKRRRTRHGSFVGEFHSIVRTRFLKCGISGSRREQERPGEDEESRAAKCTAEIGE